MRDRKSLTGWVDHTQDVIHRLWELDLEILSARMALAELQALLASEKEEGAARAYEPHEFLRAYS